MYHRSLAICSLALLLYTGSVRANPINTSPIVTFDVPGSAGTLGNGVNDNGDVVGYFSNPATGTVQGFVRLGNGTFGNPIAGPNDGGITQGYGINTSGTVVGGTGRDGFILNGSSFQQYDVAGSDSTRVNGINNNGDFAGQYTSSQANQSFVNIGGVETTFAIPRAVLSQANGINDLDQVVGWYEDSSFVAHGYYRDASGNVSSIDYPGANGTIATGINDAGVIVGYYTDSSFQEHGFTDDNGNFQTFDISRAELTEINGINNFGDISGTYLDFAGNAHAFVTGGPHAVAAPEPATLTLLALGAPGLVAVVRRRKSIR
jgi:probable HAF family extracellular repeat protein